MNVFSTKLQGLRLVWDATSLSSYMADPLSYYVKHLLGWGSDEEPLTFVFGRLYHSGVEDLWNGVPLAEVLTTMTGAARELELDRLVAEAPPTQARGRGTRELARCLTWYYEWRRDADFEVLAQEEVLTRELPPDPVTEEPRLWVGRIDARARFLDTGQVHVRERKTTNTTITSGSYWAQFDPSLQVWGYDWLMGGSDTLSGRVVLEACQTGATFARFEQHVVTRTPTQRAAFEPLVCHWIDKASRDALHETWFPNLAIKFPGDASRQMAKWAPEELRDRLAQTGEFAPGVWNPLTGARDWATPK